MLLKLTDLLFFIRGSAFSLAPVRVPFDLKKEPIRWKSKESSILPWTVTFRSVNVS